MVLGTSVPYVGNLIPRDLLLFDWVSGGEVTRSNVPILTKTESAAISSGPFLRNYEIKELNKSVT